MSILYFKKTMFLSFYLSVMHLGMTEKERIDSFLHQKKPKYPWTAAIHIRMLDALPFPLKDFSYIFSCHYLPFASPSPP